MQRTSWIAGNYRAGWIVLAVLALVVVSGCGRVRDPGPADEKVVKPAPAAPIELASYTETIPGTNVKFEMIAIPGGTFVMGSPASETGRKEDEGPQHRVTLSPFWIGKTEVTWDEYELFIKACPPPPRDVYVPAKDYVDGATGPTFPYGDVYRGFGGGKRPAIGMSWFAGLFYCQWLSAVTGKTYRLPTEAEWEYACRAGSEGAYCFGDDATKLDEYAWNTDNTDYQTHPVATKKPNAWGIFDMHGNASEWCLDWYEPKYYLSLPPDKWPKDPKGPETGKNHGFRGGSWNGKAEELRSAARDRSRDSWLTWDPTDPKSHWWLVPTNWLGFRIVRTPEDKAPKAPPSTNGL